jgi:hypothetical protein
MESLQSFQSIVVHQFEQLPIPANATHAEREEQKQNGAKHALIESYNPISAHMASNNETTATTTYASTTRLLVIRQRSIQPNSFS